MSIVGSASAYPLACACFKLSSNETPFGPSPAAIDAFRAAATSYANRLAKVNPPEPPPIPRAPKLESPPLRNTFAGVGATDQAIAVPSIEMLGATTAPSMPVVHDDATTTPIERVDPPTLPPIADPPPPRRVDDSVEMAARQKAAEALPPLGAQAADALAKTLPPDAVAPPPIVVPPPQEPPMTSAPLSPAREPTQPLPLLIPVEYSVMLPPVVILPTREPPYSVNHKLPSEPRAMPIRLLPLIPDEY